LKKKADDKVKELTAEDTEAEVPEAEPEVEAEAEVPEAEPEFDFEVLDLAEVSEEDTEEPEL